MSSYAIHVCSHVILPHVVVTISAVNHIQFVRGISHIVFSLEQRVYLSSMKKIDQRTSVNLPLSNLPRIYTMRGKKGENLS